MILTVRPLSHISPRNQVAIAEAIVQLAKRRDTERVLRAFYPDVQRRYGVVDSATKSLERASARPDVSAYILMIVQGKRAPYGDGIVFRDTKRLQREIGALSTRHSKTTNERVVGIGTVIDGQILDGVRKVTRPQTWGMHKGWHNLAMWCDPRLGEFQELYGGYLARISPADSFVMVDKPATVANRTVIDPALYIVRSGLFTEVPGVVTHGTRQSDADGIGSTPTTRTYVRSTSKLFTAD